MGCRRFTLLCTVVSLAATLACGPSEQAGSHGDEAETGGSETGDGDGDGENLSALTLVAITYATSGPLTEPNPPDRVELVAVDFDAPEPTAIPVTVLGAGAGVGYSQWIEGHGQVLQAGEFGAPATAKLVRLEHGEPIATPITPAGTVGRIRWLAFTPDGRGALVKLSSSFELFPEPDPYSPEECELVWVGFDEARQPVGATKLEKGLLDCTTNDMLPELVLDEAGELAAWLVVVGDVLALRVVEIDGTPGPVQTLAQVPKHWEYGLFVDADKLGLTTDLDNDGEQELVVYDRADLDAPPASYPFEGPNQFASWSDDRDWVVWRPGQSTDVMFMAFDGVVPTTPVPLVGPEVAGGFGQTITAEGKIRFIYAAPNPEPGGEPITRRGFAEVEVGPEGPGPATPISETLADDEQVWKVEYREGSRAAAYEIQSVPTDADTIGFAVVDSDPPAIDQRVLEVAAGTSAETMWAPGPTRRFIIVESQPGYRISVVDLDAPAPWAEVVAEDGIAELGFRRAGWSARGDHILVEPRNPEGVALASVARVPVSGGEPELVVEVEDARISGWWTLPALGQ